MLAMEAGIPGCNGGGGGVDGVELSPAPTRELAEEAPLLSVRRCGLGREGAVERKTDADDAVDDLWRDKGGRLEKIDRASSFSLCLEVSTGEAVDAAKDVGSGGGGGESPRGESGGTSVV